MARKSARLPDRQTVIERARLGLDGVASGDHIGQPGEVDFDESVATVCFDSLLPGYPGWQWRVSLGLLDPAEPSVLEVHLTPGPEALVAPDWVPWADRLEEYRRHEAERAEAEADDDDDIDEEDLDDADIDGVDIDQLDLDPAGLEIPDDINDVFDHLDFDEPES